VLFIGRSAQAGYLYRIRESRAQPGQGPPDAPPSMTIAPLDLAKARRLAGIEALPYYRSGTRKMLRLGLCTPHSA
jgi:hypothetical protein